MAAPRRAKQQGNETAVAEDEWTTRHGGGAALLPGARGALRPVGPGSRRSVLLVKLTDSALRALETPPGQRGTSSPQPKICLGGDKGYMKIPVPLSESPSGFRTFSIYRSRDGAQGSFDCVHQHVDRLGVPRLDCVGTVQEKLTICATDDSYQTTRERMAQAEEETRSRGAIVIKPGGPFNGKRTVRRLPPELMDLAPGRKRSAPLNPANTLRKAPLAGTNSAAAATTAAALRPASPAAAAAAASSGPAEALRRPMRERVVHFLALRPCKKAELVARLERDAGGVGGGGQCDRSQVFAILEQVAAPRGQDGRQQLKEAAYAEVRPDWPGYSPEERRAVQALLSRQRDMETQRETVAQREGETQKDREAQRESDRERERNRERQRDRDQERQRQRLRDLERDKQRERDRERARQEEKNKQQERERQEERDKQRERERQAERDKQRERDRERQAERDKQQERERQAERDKQQERERQAERDKQQERERQAERDKQQERERQEERDKQQERERQAEMEKRREQENSKAVTEPAEEMEVDSQGVSEEEMQYKKDYVPIVTPEQRERYKADFSSEFSEYRRLHRRIDTVKRRFEQLQHKMHALAPDSREQQVIRKQVVQEYSKVKKTNPEYQQEKRRCEYLHSKLAHIKQLITDYDQSS
ncbi:unnamed protein product [Lampetra fluviatilis]